jgi:hypothetical protein
MSGTAPVSTSTAQAAQAVVHEDTSGAYALAMFISTFSAGYTPKIDVRTPADIRAGY